LTSRVCIWIKGLTVTGERFEFLDLLTIRVESVQIGKISTAGFSQQIGVDLIGFGSRRRPSSLDRSWVHRIDRPAGFEQMGNQETVFGLHDASHLLLATGSRYPFQISIQLAQSFWGVSNPDRADLTSLFINGEHVVVISGPIDAAKPHDGTPFLFQHRFLKHCVLILWRSKRDSLMTSHVQERRRGRTSFLKRSSRVEHRAFPQRVRQFPPASVSLAAALCREGLLLV
jgi:hypothetical protein